MRVCHLVLIALGSLSLMQPIAFSANPWNPLSFMNSEDSKSGNDSGAQSAARTAKTSSPRIPISVSTRRMILLESMKYPPDQRQMMIGSFNSLSNQEAIEKLHEYKSNRIRNTQSLSTAKPASNPTAKPASTSRIKSFFTPDVRVVDRNPPGATAIGPRQPVARPSEMRLQTTTTRPTSTINREQNPSPSSSTPRTFSLTRPQTGVARIDTRQAPPTRQEARTVDRNRPVEREQPSQAAGYTTYRPLPSALQSDPLVQRQSRPMAQPDQTSRQPVLAESSRQPAPSPGRAPVGDRREILPVGAETTDDSAALQWAVDTSGQNRSLEIDRIADHSSDDRAKIQMIGHSMGGARPGVPETQSLLERPRPTSPQIAPQMPTRFSAREGLQQMITRAEAVVASSKPGSSEQELQAYIENHVNLKMLYLLDGQREKAITAIPGIPSNEQAFWTRIFWGLSNYLDDEGYPDKTDRTTAALDQMRAAILTLQGNARLAIANAAFCLDIESFGNYTRFEKSEFLPGQEVLIYIELDNFQSERTDDGRFRTVLKSSVRLYQDERPVDEVQYNATEDLSRSRRQDFMQGFRYEFPQRLAAGDYRMLITIEDQLSGKSSESTLKLTVR